jgi:MFS transporter, FSR family, fosmidomycin resistance protein
VASWPLIRADFRLSYTTVGVLLTVPGLLADVIEPLFGLMADAGRRRRLVFGGGVVFACSLFLTALAPGFAWLLLAFLVFAPASGAFVSLSQAALMDLAPDRHESNMARWVLAGSIGVLLGPVILAGALAAGLGWRPVFLLLGALTLPLIVLTRVLPFAESPAQPLEQTLRAALGALRRGRVLRLLLLLELTDLLGDVFIGFLALYLVDVAGIRPLVAAAAVGVWSVAGLAGDAGLVLLLERVSGALYLRASALLVLIAFPVFLLAPDLRVKLAAVAVLGLSHTGWYAIPKARLFTELSGSSGAALALSNLAGLAGELSPLLIGLLAQRLGLGAALWALLIAPVAVLALPREREAPDANGGAGFDG